MHEKRRIYRRFFQIKDTIMKHCTICGTLTQDDAELCPYCGGKSFASSTVPSGEPFAVYSPTASQREENRAYTAVPGHEKAKIKKPK